MLSPDVQIPVGLLLRRLVWQIAAIISFYLLYFASAQAAVTVTMYPVGSDVQVVASGTAIIPSVPGGNVSLGSFSYIVGTTNGGTPTPDMRFTRNLLSTKRFNASCSGSFATRGSVVSMAVSNTMVGSAFAFTSTYVYLPTGYSVGEAAPVSSSQTYQSKTLASMGFNAGDSYTCTWGSGANADSLTFTVSSSAPISTDANLSALTISSGTLSPTFASATTSYTASVSNATSSITVTPTRNQANATITVNGTAVTSGSASGAISLNVGSNTITTVVTAQDGTTTKTYTTTVTREAAPTLTFATPTSASVTMGGSLTNAATSNYSGGSYGAISYASSATGVATVNSSGVVTPVSAGTATITATQAAVAGVNAQATQTYTLTVNVPSSTDANLSALTISSGTLSPTFASATTSYTASVSNATSSITVTPTRNQANATITVNGTAVTSGSASGAISLNVGSNTITTVVTAQDGTTTKTYTTTVTREALLSQASFTVSASSTSLFTGGTATLSTTGGSGTGSLTYVVTTGSCAISGTTLTASSSAGSCVVTATKAGDATYSAASATVTITVTAAVTRATIDQAATDSSVRATTVAQATAAQRFTGAQIQNLSSHIEVLRSNFKVTTGGLTLGVNQGITKEWMPIIDKLKDHFLTKLDGTSKQEHLLAAPQNAMYLPDLNGESFQQELESGKMKVVDPGIQSDQGILTDEGMTRVKPNTYAMNDLFNKVYQGIAKDEEENAPTYALWSLGNFDFGTIGGNNGTSPTKFSATGITVGLDYQLHKSIIVGAAIGLGFDKTNMDTLGSHIDSIQKTISTYGIYQPYKNLFLDGSIGYGSVYFNGARIVTYDASNTSLGMSRTGNSIFSSIGVGYQYVSGNLQYQPFIRTTVSQLNLNSYSESGPSSYALAYGPSTSVSTTTSAGLQGMYDILVDNGKWTPSAKLMVSNNSGGAMTQSAYYADVGAAGGTYYLNSISLPTYTESAGISLKYSYKRNMSMELGYLGTIGNNSYRANSIRLDARIMF